MVAANDLEPENRDNTVPNPSDEDNTTDGEWSDAVSAVHDDTETDDVVEDVSYRIASYGLDFDMEGLVNRINRGSIFVPDFQRGFVWTRKQASQFIESLLLGLPVPGIFLTMELGTEKMMVVDGQQRLKTLQYFYAGAFEENGRPFALQGVARAFEGKTYADLREPDRNRLNNAMIHATVTRQLFPEEGLSSVFHIFQRLNSTGQRLTPQEIRQAIYQGSLLSAIKEMNADANWRAMFGPEHRRQKDQELILRFWALYLQSEQYQAPMLKFLNDFAEDNREPNEDFLSQGKELFIKVVKSFNDTLGKRAFRTTGSSQINAAVFDSMAVGLAQRIRHKGMPESNALKAATDALLKDMEYLDSVSGGTARPASVQTRIAKATKVLGGV